MILIKKILKSLIAFVYVSIDSFSHFRYAAPDDGFISVKLKEYSKITILEKDLHKLKKVSL